jgi:hypothetical protein
MNKRKLVSLVRKMIKADQAYGCGFYGEDDWIDAYDKLAEMCGVGKSWRDAQDLKKSKAHWASIKKENPEHFAKMKAGGWPIP